MIQIESIRSIDLQYHSFCPDLLTAGGWVLDAGCRGFDFSSAMVNRGMRVISLDPAPDVNPPETIIGPQLHFHRMALAALTGERHFSMLGENLGWRLAQEGTPIYAEDILTLIKRWRIVLFDLVKMDIEGAETEVLDNWPGPVARQISVEFHPVASPVTRERLAPWYDLVMDTRYDSLWVLKPGYRNAVPAQL